MNKGTRTWITGIIILVISQYFSNKVLEIKHKVLEIKHNYDNLIIGISVFCYLFCLALSAYGINLILKSINK